MICSENFRVGDFVRRQEGVLDQLLRERAGARAGTSCSPTHVGEERADDGDGIDARVGVEAAVFDGEDRLDHLLRDQGERHVAPFLARGGDERGDERRVERQAIELLLLRDDFDVIDRRRLRAFRAARGVRDPQELAFAVAVLRHHQHRIAAHGELPGLFRPWTMGIAEVVQPVDDLARRQRLAPPQLERAGEDPGIGALHFAVQPRVDHPGKADVEIASDDRQDQERDPETEKDVELPAPPASGRARFGRDDGARRIDRHG